MAMYVVCSYVHISLASMGVSSYCMSILNLTASRQLFSFSPAGLCTIQRDASLSTRINNFNSRFHFG